MSCGGLVPAVASADRGEWRTLAEHYLTVPEGAGHAAAAKPGSGSQPAQTPQRNELSPPSTRGSL